MIMITVSDFNLSCIDLELGMSCDNNSTVLETQIFSVSVSVSSLRLRCFQSRSRSRH
jgi:hypothetical protein